MLTDWVLIARLAAELSERLRGARVRGAGILNDGRVALSLRSRGAPATLAVDPFFSPPMVTLENGDAGVTPGPGFGRALADSLVGMVLGSVSARRHDRLLKLVFRARSKFGVSDELVLYLELVPRFGNVVLAKGERVIAALKEFAPAAPARRSVLPGHRYELPPLPERPRTLAAAPEPDDRLQRPIHVYRRDGGIVAAYVSPLDSQKDSSHTLEGSLLDVFAQLRAQHGLSERSQQGERRRERLFRRLEERERKARAELAALSEKRRYAADRDSLRRDGEEIFATLHARPIEERAASKHRAAALFSEYKKLGKSLPHLELRVRDLTALLASIETLRWETERARDEDLADVEAAAAQLEPRQKSARTRAAPAKRRRAALEFRTVHGSRILVGRSPLDNAELTFRVARPDDLWFHAQGIPGAHVILSRDDRSAIPAADLSTAAELAAFHSRGKESAVVLVDYTRRKHVRKQRAAPPGLVWYTHAQTIAVTPKAFE